MIWELESIVGVFFVVGVVVFVFLCNFIGIYVFLFIWREKVFFFGIVVNCGLVVLIGVSFFLFG